MVEFGTALVSAQGGLWLQFEMGSRRNLKGKKWFIIFGNDEVVLGERGKFNFKLFCHTSLA